MYFESVQQNVDFLDRSKFDFLTKFHDHVIGEGGLIDENFKLYLPQLTLCKYEDQPLFSPGILHSGSQSGTRQVFGEKWADNLPEHEGTPDLELERMAAPGYCRAAETGFSCDLVETVANLPDGRKRLTFVRYIAKLETYSGVRFFALAGTVLDHTLQ